MRNKGENVEARRRAAIDRLTQAYRERLEKELDLSDATLDEIEERSFRLGKAAEDDIRNEISESAGDGYSGTRTACACGLPARYVGVRPRHIVTLRGALTIRRACYHCAACRRVFSPLDRRLGLLRQGCSRRVLAASLRFCSFLSFGPASREMEYICGIRLAPSTLERYCQQTGAILRADWERREDLVWSRKMPPSARRPKQLQASMDGTSIFVDGEWREAKLAAVFEPAAKGAERTRYYASLESSSQFGRKARTLIAESGSDRCANLGIVADGGVWIWRETAKYFPRSTQILDYYHASGHVWEAARLRFGDGSSECKEWMSRQEAAMLEGRVGDVIADIQRWEPRGREAHDVRRRLLAYLSGHEKRMRYPEFQAQGWHIGSGVIESGCKCVVKARLGGAARRWSRKGADAMLHICAHWRSDGETDFMKYVS